ncbi:phosphoenolpyruvate carboxylase 4-like isoform X2 [Rosa rugosa]|nr:phosphoenolpyruvate carboxylase 4-like isoform X2 [Rosa rugosa]
MRLAGMEDTTELLEKKQASEISKMSLEEALTLARAFSHYLNLMGIAEVHHRSLNDLGKKKKRSLFVGMKKQSPDALSSHPKVVSVRIKELAVLYQSLNLQ